MLVDGDTVRLEGPNMRLTGWGDVAFDTPETHQAECPYEADLGDQATALVRSMMPGKLCIIEFEGSGYGRHLGVLFGSDGEDVRGKLMRDGFYNPRRRHSALGWKSPLVFAAQAA